MYCYYSMRIIHQNLEDIGKVDITFWIFRVFLIIVSLSLIVFEIKRWKNSKSFLTTFFLGVNIAYIIKQFGDFALERWFLHLYDSYNINISKEWYERGYPVTD